MEQCGKPQPYHKYINCIRGHIPVVALSMVLIGMIPFC